MNPELRIEPKYKDTIEKVLDNLNIHLVYVENCFHDLEFSRDPTLMEILDCHDMILYPTPRFNFLNEDAEEYLVKMHSSVSRNIKHLLSKLERFIKDPKLGIQSTDLVVEVSDFEFLRSFVPCMQESPWTFRGMIRRDLKRFPKTKNVRWYQWETDEIQVVWNLIRSFTDMDPSKILECHRLVLGTGKGAETKYLHKNFVDNLTSFEIYKTLENMKWNITSPFSISSTKILFGEYTRPGEDLGAEDKLYVVNQITDGLEIKPIKKSRTVDGSLVNNGVMDGVDGGVDGTMDGSLNDIFVTGTMDGLESGSGNNNGTMDGVDGSGNNNGTVDGSECKKRKRKVFGRFKLIYIQGVYEEIGQLLIKCKIGKAVNSKYNF